MLFFVHIFSLIKNRLSKRFEIFLKKIFFSLIPIFAFVPQYYEQVNEE